MNAIIKLFYLFVVRLFDRVQFLIAIFADVEGVWSVDFSFRWVGVTPVVVEAEHT